VRIERKRGAKTRQNSREQPANPEIFFDDHRIDAVLVLIVAEKQLAFFRRQGRERAHVGVPAAIARK